MPTLGGAPRRVVSAFYMVPSPDGASIFYIKFGSFGIFRAGKSGLDEELVYNFEGTGLFFVPLLISRRQRLACCCFVIRFCAAANPFLQNKYNQP